MHKFVLTEIFTITVAIILGLTFYILLTAGALIGISNFLTLITHLILIIAVLLLLAIFMQITRIEFYLRNGKTGTLRAQTTKRKRRKKQR